MQKLQFVFIWMLLTVSLLLNKLIVKIPTMKSLFSIVMVVISAQLLHGQNSKPNDKQGKEITSLIDSYSLAREKKDTVLLKQILTNDIDQLVSTGEWRDGIGTAVKGMLRSSATTPGTRTLTVDKVRMLTDKSAIVDCKYNIKNDDGTQRNMWSTFVVISDKGKWKISAIRNMLPSGN